MRKLLLLLCLGSSSPGFVQGITARHLLTAPGLSESKFQNFITQKGFAPAGVSSQQDTVEHTYYFRGRKKEERKDSTVRSFCRQYFHKEAALTYQTASLQEFMDLRKELEQDGFLAAAVSRDSTVPVFYQSGDYTVHAGIEAGDQPMYFLRIKKRKLPDPRRVRFAEDLLLFNSHEQLVSVFGKGAVLKDLYYFSENEFSRCSVLFPRSSRQAVFIWHDEENNYGLSAIVLGNQLVLGSLKDDDRPVIENSWELKSGVRTGMHMQELRRLHGKDFSFYHIHSRFSGMVLPSREGNLDFEREVVVLSCMNCGGDDYPTSLTQSADEVLAAGFRLIVFSVILYPRE